MYRPDGAEGCEDATFVFIYICSAEGTHRTHVTRHT